MYLKCLNHVLILILINNLKVFFDSLYQCGVKKNIIYSFNFYTF